MGVYTEERPWGKFEVLYSGFDTKVKRITVNSGHRLSYQYHHKRSERWVVVSGKGIFTLNEESMVIEHPGQVLFIPVGARHRIENNGTEPLVFVEVQLGEAFDENDIVRIADDYSRTQEN